MWTRVHRYPSHTVSSSNGTTLLIIPMRRDFFPTPEWIGCFYVFAVFVIPIWVAAAWLYRWIKQIPVPPRARFSVSQDQFLMEFVDWYNGERTSFEYKPSQITELRKNRFENGLWVRVAGVKSDTYLHDIHEDVVESVCIELNAALDRCRE